MSRLDARHWTVVGGSIALVLVLGFAGLANLPLQGGPAAPKDTDPATRQEHDQHGGSASTDRSLSPHGLVLGEPPGFTHAHAFPSGDGVIPTRNQAMGFEDRYSEFRARGSDGLDRLADQGHLSGSGTVEDPYVLEKFYVDGDLVMQSTHQALVIREGYVTGQFKLNYVGSDLLVHHVYAEDLRVNENVDRSGPDTAGLFHDNEFGFIGQFRHFSGEFRDNKVGPKPQGVAMTYLSDTGVAEIPEGRVFNFDGFLGADVHSNEIVGRVDIKLHGHYHGDCLECSPHDHNNESYFPPEDRDDDGNASTGHEHHESEHGESSSQKAWMEEMGMRSHHSIRYHSLWFHDNEIRVENDEVALRYNDRNHNGDDETAASEPNPYLEDPHVHFQYVWLQGNTLVGGRLMLDVFNAEDDDHAVDNLGVFHVQDNTITVHYERSTMNNPPPAHGMRLTQAEGIEMLVEGNTIRFEEKGDDLPLATLRSALKHEPERIGIIASSFDRGNVSFTGNQVETGDVGLFVNSLSERVWWFVEENRFPTGEPVRATNNENPANEAPPEPEEEEDEDDPSGGDEE